MFPKTTDVTALEQALQANAEQDFNIYKTPEYDFENCKTVFKNGIMQFVDGERAVKQWITKFIKICIDRVFVYKGTGFGTNARELFGNKYLANGYEESELQRQILEGLPLCPAIDRVTDFNMTKVDTLLEIELTAVMKDGTNVKVEVENDITID